MISKNTWYDLMLVNRFLSVWFVLGGFTQDAGFFLLTIIPSFTDIVICKSMYELLSEKEEE